MLADGAHLNVDADRALETILGDKPSPTKDERKSDTEFADWIRSAKSPDGEELDYGETSRYIAKLYLMAMENGCQGDEGWDVWPEILERWPGEAAKVEGSTGFMHGWAFNAARKVLNMPPAPNPALLEIEV